MRILSIILMVSVGTVLLSYAIVPTKGFPEPLPGSRQSEEEADTEYIFRRAYFTDFNREEVIAHYQEQFKLSILGIEIPAMRLNYPPEDAQVLIRDQTRSTFLEELVYPLRESFFINGFKPSVAKDEIWYKGVHYEQKITVRYVPSNPLVRIAVVLGILACVSLVCRFTLTSIKDFLSTFRVLLKK